MPQFLGPGRVRYFKANGDLLPGGLLSVFEPGTTTNRDSYPTQADALAGTNANANPVVLDAEGYADVVLKGNSKLVLKDADSVTLWTLDNVNYETVSPLLDTNDNEAFCFNTTTSAVNHVCVTNSITNVGPQVSPEGSDTNIDLTLKTKGAGEIDIEAASIQLEDAEGILDDSGNQQLIFQKTTTAVNEFQMTNAATGNAPELEVTGGNTDIDMKFQAKGTGAFVYDGTATAQAEIRLSEDTDNGTNYFGIKPPAALTASTTWTTPDGLPASVTQGIQITTGGVISYGSLPGLSLLLTATASNSSSLTFASLINSTFDEYMFVLSDIILADDNQLFRMRTSTDGGVGYDSTASDYHTSHYFADSNSSTATLVSAAATAINLGSVWGNASGESLSGVVRLHKPTSTSITLVSLKISGIDAAGNLNGIQGVGMRDSAADVDAVQFFSGVNITSGIIRMYGVLI